ncbi:hypothetical protein RYX36_013773 [Vicia faba]
MYTDTTYVLHEAIDYIKFLHDQVNVLSSTKKSHGKWFAAHGGGGRKEHSFRRQCNFLGGVELVPTMALLFKQKMKAIGDIGNEFGEFCSLIIAHTIFPYRLISHFK